MSAFQVSPDHIEAMLAAANSFGRQGCGPFSYYHEGERHVLATGAQLNEAGSMLWRENARSLAVRYPDHACSEFEMVPDLGADWQFRPSRQRTPSPVEALKLCACYRYQACETEDYEETEAAAFVNSLERFAIAALPGYDEAPWEWSRAPVA